MTAKTLQTEKCGLSGPDWIFTGTIERQYWGPFELIDCKWQKQPCWSFFFVRFQRICGNSCVSSSRPRNQMNSCVIKLTIWCGLWPFRNQSKSTHNGFVTRGNIAHRFKYCLVLRAGCFHYKINLKRVWSSCTILLRLLITIMDKCKIVLAELHASTTIPQVDIALPYQIKSSWEYNINSNRQMYCDACILHYLVILAGSLASISRSRSRSWSRADVNLHSSLLLKVMCTCTVMLLHCFLIVIDPSHWMSLDLERTLLKLMYKSTAMQIATASLSN